MDKKGWPYAPIFRSTMVLLTAGAVLFGIHVVRRTAELSQRKKASAHLRDYGALLDFDPQREGGHLLPDLDELVVGAYFGDPVRFITNSKGFRNDREFAYKPQPGTLRVLFLGDSFVDGMRTDQKRTMGYVLEQFISRNLQGSDFRHCEVLISGHNNPANAWYYYQEHGRRFAPHVVVLGVTLGNDLTWHNYGAGIRSSFDDSGIRVLEVAPSVGSAGKHKKILLPPEAYRTRGVWDSLGMVAIEFKFRSFLANRSDLFAYSVPPKAQPWPSRAWHAYAAGFSTSLGLFYRPVMREFETMFQDFEEVLAGFDVMAEKTGADFVAVLFPVRFQVSAGDWNLLRRSLALDGSNFDLDYPNRRFKATCARADISCLDVTEDLRRHRRQRLYRPLGDMHLSERGQEIAAESIGRVVLAGIGESSSDPAH